MTLPVNNSFPSIPDSLLKLPDGITSLPDSFNQLPDDFVLLQVNPDIAANLWGKDERSRHWLYARDGEHRPWTPFRKMDRWDVRQAEDQYDEGIVINGNVLNQVQQDQVQQESEKTCPKKTLWSNLKFKVRHLLKLFNA